MHFATRAALVAGFTLAASTPALSTSAVFSAPTVHDDDPKVLDRVPNYRGQGMRRHANLGVQLASVANPPLPFTSQNVMQLAWLPLADFGVSASGNANVCWGYVSPSGTNYALIGLSTGTGFVRLSDPANPEIVAVMSGPSSLWRDVRVFGNYAYAVSEGGGGIQVFNLSQIDSDVVTLANTITTGGVTDTHTVWIDTVSGYLYRCGGGSTDGLRIYNLNASATNPPFVVAWNTMYVHEVRVNTYTSGPNAGKQIAFVCGGFNGGSTNTGLRILDVTNKASITMLDEVFWPTPAYSHQVDLSADGTIAYLNDELDEQNSGQPTKTEVFNVANLTNVTRLGSFTNNNTAIGHNLYVEGNLIYEANYRSGLRVFDVSAGPLNAVEVAHFDTWDGDDAAEFNGLWMTYPYLPNGVVLGSDIEKGLFVWWVGAPLIALDLVATEPAYIHPSGMTVAATIAETQAGALVAGSEQLFYDAGAGLQSAPLVNNGGGNYDVVFPALPCGSTVSWYIAATSTNGITWTYPAGGAGAPLNAVVAVGATTIAQLDMETASGWVAGDTGDNATSGVWTRANPVGTAAQPEDDHTAAGATCWVTGNATAGASVGTNDVDNGTTTLKSAVYNLAGASDPHVSYWRWFSNNQNSAVDDSFVVQVNAGSGWVTVETVGPAGSEAQGGWFHHDFRVADFVTPSATVQVRFRASDLGTGSIVEAAIDDFAVSDLDCSAPTAYCTAGTSANGCVATMSASGTPSASASSGFTLTASNVEGQKVGLLFYGVNGTLANSWGGGSSSFLCVKAPTQRTAPQSSNGTVNQCDGALSIDWLAYIAAHPTALGAPFSAGDDVWSQAWYRDPPSPNTTSLSNGLVFTLTP